MARSEGKAVYHAVEGIDLGDEVEPLFSQLDDGLLQLREKRVDLRRGDMVRYLEKDHYRNEGDVIFDGEKLVQLFDHPDDYGTLPREFRVIREEDGGFPIRYWEGLIAHNSWVWLTRGDLLDQMIDNIRYDRGIYGVQACLYTWFDYKGKIYFIVYSADQVMHLSQDYIDDFIEHLSDEDRPFSWQCDDYGCPPLVDENRLLFTTDGMFNGEFDGKDVEFIPLDDDVLLTRIGSTILRDGKDYLAFESAPVCAVSEGTLVCAVGKIVHVGAGNSFTVGQLPNSMSNIVAFKGQFFGRSWGKNYRSKDGIHWAECHTAEWATHEAWLSVCGEALVVWFSNNIEYSRDGETWTSVKTFHEVMYVTSKNVIVGKANKLGVLWQGWALVLDPEDNVRVIVPFNDGLVHISARGLIHFSDDEGETWTARSVTPRSIWSPVVVQQKLYFIEDNDILWTDDLINFHKKTSVPLIHGLIPLHSDVTAMVS